jgi:hypothetical protein
MMRTSLLISVFLLLSMALQAADEKAGDESAAVPQRTPSSDGAAVSFLNLNDGDQVPTTFTVKFLISGMGIAPAGSNIENTGHHHLLIDLTELPDMSQPLPSSQKLQHFGKGQSETELTLPEGSHTLQLLFADYQHRPHDPVVISEKITIIVSKDAVQAEKQP